MYVDPNTGGIVFTILASLLGVAYALLLTFSSKIKQAIAKLRRSVRKDKGEEQE